MKWIASLTAIVSIWLYGNGWKYLDILAWLVNFFGGGFHYMILTSMYVLCGFMTATHIRNIIRMKNANK